MPWGPMSSRLQQASILTKAVQGVLDQIESSLEELLVPERLGP